ncbi:MAG: response regulator transcription factor [Taibaiella sp.]|nr:response regulator transcription factor [Taibaiella sp.]
MRVIIVDDEPIARDILKVYAAKLPQLELAGTCKNAVETIELLKSETADLLLLDINMPGMSGMELIKQLKNPPLIILTTAYSQYAVESYELNAVDYLLKPFSFTRFEKAVAKAAELLERKKEDDTIFVKCDGKLVKIALNELELIEAVKDYVKLWAGDKSLMVLSTMKNMEEQLSGYPQIVRVHKSYMLNVQHVRQLSGNTIHTASHVVPIGNTYKEMVTEVFNKYRLI